MKIFTLLLVFFLACSSPISTPPPISAPPPTSAPSPIPSPTLPMELSSTAFTTGIPSIYTCDGQDVNPPLTISEPPAGTQSLALIVDDPDAPGGTWVHWLVWNIDPTTTEIAENSVPASATQGTTDFGNAAWGGPCPPSGTHRYFFKLYALDSKLELPSTAKKADLEAAMQGHILEQVEFISTYSR